MSSLPSRGCHMTDTTQRAISNYLDVLTPRQVESLHRRMWPKIDFTGDCWEWTRAVDKGGYGVFGYLHTANTTRNGRVHRIVWNILVGSIPFGLVMDHLCRNHACCNPDHFEPVTDAVNLSRSLATYQAIKRQAKACKRGHAFTEVNTYIKTQKSGLKTRSCRRCHSIAERTRQDRLRDEQQAAA